MDQYSFNQYSSDEEYETEKILFIFTIHKKREPTPRNLGIPLGPSIQEVTDEVFACEMGGHRPITVGEVTKFAIEQEGELFHVKLELDTDDKSLVMERIMNRYGNCECS